MLCECRDADVGLSTAMGGDVELTGLLVLPDPSLSYTLPLLPGYSANTKVRSSPAVKSPGTLAFCRADNPSDLC